MFKLQNKMFALGGILGVFDRGFKRLKSVRSEVNLLTIGPAWFITLPGEVNPEILNGGIETPEGRDFTIQHLVNRTWIFNSKTSSHNKVV